MLPPLCTIADAGVTGMRARGKAVSRPSRLIRRISLLLGVWAAAGPGAAGVGRAQEPSARVDIGGSEQAPVGEGGHGICTPTEHCVATEASPCRALIVGHEEPACWGAVSFGTEHGE